MQNKMVMITGAGGGVGSALTRLLVSKGAKVAAIDAAQPALDKLKDCLLYTSRCV